MTTKLSQTELYGELLTSRQLYLRDMAPVEKKLSNAEENALVARIQQGDMHAKEDLLASLYRFLPYHANQLCTAYPWLTMRQEYLDVIQEGHINLLTKFSEAMTKDEPVSWLKNSTKLAMRRYCLQYEQAITVPKEKKNFTVESLDVPITEGATETMAAVLPGSDLLLEEPIHDTFEPLYHAIECAGLTEKQRDVLVRLYGLFNQCTETVPDLVKAKGVYKNVIQAHRNTALKKLRAVLSSHPLLQGAYSHEPVFTANAQ